VTAPLALLIIKFEEGHLMAIRTAPRPGVLLVCLVLAAMSAVVVAADRAPSDPDVPHLYLPLAIGRPGLPVPSERILFSLDSDVNSVRADGTDPIHISGSYGVLNYAARWSPDRTQIVLIEQINYYYPEVVIMDADGSNGYIVPLPRTLEAISKVAWSPDGKRLALDAFVDGVGRDIYIVNTDGTNLTNVTQDLPGGGWLPTWSPDGAHIVFTHFYQSNGIEQTDLMSIRPDGSDPVMLTNNGDSVDETRADWSPDGTTILFTGQPKGTSEYNLYTIPTAGGTAQLLLNNGFLGFWSPDGTQIVFTAIGPDFSYAGIWRMDRQGTLILPVIDDVRAGASDW
jgi:Tol biopolymer transport system component